MKARDEPTTAKRIKAEPRESVAETGARGSTQQASGPSGTDTTADEKLERDQQITSFATKMPRIPLTYMVPRSFFLAQEPNASLITTMASVIAAKIDTCSGSRSAGLATELPQTDRKCDRLRADDPDYAFYECFYRRLPDAANLLGMVRSPKHWLAISTQVFLPDGLPMGYFMNTDTPIRTDRDNPKDQPGSGMPMTEVIVAEGCDPKYGFLDCSKTDLGPGVENGPLSARNWTREKYNMARRVETELFYRYEACKCRPRKIETPSPSQWKDFAANAAFTCKCGAMFRHSMTENQFCDYTEIATEAAKEVEALRVRLEDRFIATELPWDSTGPVDTLSLRQFRNVPQSAHLCDGADLPVSRLGHEPPHTPPTSTSVKPKGEPSDDQEGAVVDVKLEIGPPPGLELPKGE